MAVASTGKDGCLLEEHGSGATSLTNTVAINRRIHMAMAAFLVSSILVSYELALQPKVGDEQRRDSLSKMSMYVFTLCTELANS